MSQRGRSFVFLFEMANDQRSDTGILWRIILVVVGFGVAMTGWALIMTAILSFVGLPLFIFGLALMQAQES